MEKDFAERLKNFESVWRRVQKARPPASGKNCYQCRKAQQNRKPSGRARRFSP